MDSFVTALHSLAETCEYGTLKGELIRDRIVIGVRDARTSERLQLMADLTLEKALNVARQAEIQAKEEKMLRKEEISELNKISRFCKNKEEKKKKKRGKTKVKCQRIMETAGSAEVQDIQTVKSVRRSNRHVAIARKLGIGTKYADQRRYSE